MSHARSTSTRMITSSARGSNICCRMAPSVEACTRVPTLVLMRITGQMRMIMVVMAATRKRMVQMTMIIVMMEAKSKMEMVVRMTKVVMAASRKIMNTSMAMMMMAMVALTRMTTTIRWSSFIPSSK